MASTMLKSRAEPKPETLNPGTIALASMMMSALMTNVKSPNVRIFTGNVRRTMSGLIKAFKRPRTIAVNIADNIPTVAPGRMRAVIKIAAADMSQESNIYLKLVFKANAESANVYIIHAHGRPGHG